MKAITISAFGATSVTDCAWTVPAVRAAVRRMCSLHGSITVTLGARRGVAAHVDEQGALLVVLVERVS